MASSATIERKKNIPVFIPLNSLVSFPEEALDVFAPISFLVFVLNYKLQALCNLEWT